MITLRSLCMVTLMLTACGQKRGAGDMDTGDHSHGADTAPHGSGDSGDTGGRVEELMGFIGSPCESDTDCEYEGGVCLLEGFENGMCSAACDMYCPDAEGYPVTFCVDTNELPPAAAELGGGACLSRCDFGIYPTDACREHYGCAIESRYGEPETKMFACLPGREPELSSCHYELADRGVDFEPTFRYVDHPDGYPELDCTIDDPVWIKSPVLGVDMKYYDGTETPRTLAACEMAHSLADTVDDVAREGVTALIHLGTYNCRVISGTTRLSRHSYADAIDIYGFEFSDGRIWTLEEHWEHDTDEPESEAAQFLYSAAQRWYEDWIWNIILTPNYNDAHDNHFHIDLTPGSHTVSVNDHRYFGPAPYLD